MSGETFRKLLSEGLDLCVRARKLDAQDRTNAQIKASCDGESWEKSDAWQRHVERHNIQFPDTPLVTKSATIALWVQEQYETDLADWERRARTALKEGAKD